MSKESDLKHALHNEEVFLHLLPKEDFADWIVNTAFYSALHFVDYKIFPIPYSESGVKISFESLDSFTVSKANTFRTTDKHVVRLKLVQNRLRDIYFEFQWLYDNCKTAGYTDYKFADQKGTCNTAKLYLEKIKNHCYIPKVKKT